MANVSSERPAAVKHILVKHIQPNPHNPRRLFDEEPMKILEESVTKLGILVPLTLYPKEKGRPVDYERDRFIILDGERRWRVAQALHLQTAPAIVVDQPSEEQNILTMFHIHNVREGWQLMPTALKLKTLMEKLEETNERKLAELTKLSVGQIRRCKILLGFPEKYQNMMLVPPSERMKADFFIELQRIRGPALEEKFPPWISRGDSRCIDTLLKKYLNGVIPAVTDFRKLAEIHRGSVKKNLMKTFYKELARFLDTPDVTIDDIDVPGATFEKEFKEINRSARRLLNQLESLDTEALAADARVLGVLRRVMRTIESKLADALTEPQHATDGED